MATAVKIVPSGLDQLAGTLAPSTHYAAKARPPLAPASPDGVFAQRCAHFARTTTPIHVEDAEKLGIAGGR
jgi:hypothetical protein